MSMLQAFNEQQNLQTATQVVYENVQFPNGFGNFLEALQIEKLISAEPSCLTVRDGYTWINEVAKGGIRLTTSKHPYVRNKEAGNLIIEGQSDNLKIVQNLLTRHNVLYEGSVHSKIRVKIEYHDELNPKLWKHNGEEYTLLPDVQSTLENAAEAFYEYLEMPKLPITDIVMTGSSANYNWTETSDLDLHIIIDMEEAEKLYGKLVVEYFDAKKKLWNDLHDISVKGIPIEFYIQSTTEKHDSTGVYSLMNEEWNLIPEHEPPSVDNSAVKAKAKEWIKKINDCIKHYDDPDKINELMQKIRTMRKAGLAEAGEFSTENLVFKVLRNQGLIDKLADYYNELFDEDLSLEEEEEDDDPWTDIGYNRPRPALSRPTTTISPKEKRTKLWLNVPYSQRESAKRMGARWDAGLRKWYIMVTNAELKNIPNAWR